MKNHLIIFSKHRASQLHLLLESIEINGNNFFDKISVLYVTYERKYELGYVKLISKFNNINFVKETNFRENLIDLLNEPFEFTTFMVDDCIIFNRLKYKSEILNLFNEDTICFSLRLGLNCEYSHPANTFYKIGKYDNIFDNVISFNYTEQDVGDFSYPLSLDGHIFKTELILKLISAIWFINPNTLEAQLQKFVNTTHIPNMVMCYKDSHSLSVPVNIVNTSFKNRNGLNYYISEYKLNEEYIKDLIIDFNKIPFENINGPHKEFEFLLKKMK